MSQQMLQEITKAFGITQQVLEERAEVGIYIQSLSALISDKYYEYLLANREFANAIEPQELPRLKRMRSETIVSLFCDPFDAKLIKKIENSAQESPLPITKFMVASIFEVTTQTLLDIASVNSELKKHLKVILKFVHIAEFVLQQHLASTKVLTQQEKTAATLRDVFESLYLMLIGHKQKHENLLQSFSGKDLEVSQEDLPSKELEKCHFTGMLEKLKKDFASVQWVQDDVGVMQDLHREYHANVATLYRLKEQGAGKEQIQEVLAKIDKISQILFEAINKPFQNSASLTFLTIKSGMRFLHHFGDTIGEIKTIPYGNKKELLQFVEDIFKNSMSNSLSWAIRSYQISSEAIDCTGDVQEKIVLQEHTLYICIKINDLPYKNFLLDALGMFLEMFKITLVNKEKEHTLLLLADRSEAANRSKDMFLANMSHELRTPLNAIIGFSQILQMKPEIPDNLKQYIQKISIAGNNLLNIVNTILDFAKLEAGKISFHPQMVYLSEMLEELSVIISPLAQAKNITVTFPNIISLGLYVDAQLIKQVLINLLSNAVKFTQEGGEVKLSVAFEREQNGYVLSVCDNGVGMSQKDMAKLFQPFSQVDNSMQSASKGTGLGLVISKKIVEDLHQGAIWAESEVGKGSCFYVSIPVTNELGKVEIYASKNEDAKNLIIVEDSQEYVDILLEKLTSSYNITVTNSITMAKELVKQHRYDLMVLDFFLTDGISSDLLTFMEYNDIMIPVQIISAEDDFKIVEHIQKSENIVGIFNKKDVALICEQIVKGVDGYK